ncbi:MAG TPA: FIST N-terminal domain-containing protein [Solirubrobacteraceae bacterium]|jgi:small ligand-binding sensory domain FIST|nr:FIST N-terminal domain-containing protein [Solirubrobacteraceae bacterium]
MAVRIGAGLSTELDPREGAMAAAAQAAAGLDGGVCELALVFASGAHLAAPEATLEGVHEALSPAALVGCGAGGVLGRGREVEDGTAVSVLALAMEAGRAEPFHASARPVDDGLVVEGLPPLAGADGVVLVSDPYSFPTDAILADLHKRAPGVPVMGGVSSARTLDGAGALFYGDEIAEEGAVGLRLEGVETLPCVSQGAAPIGPEMEITAADGHVLAELGGRPALERLREVIVGLDEHDRAMIGGGLLVGLAVEVDTPDHPRPDFLVRSLLGADPKAGTVAMGARVRPGQKIRLHARDAASADEDLRQALCLRREALGGRAPAGVLVFTCNGRGTQMFGEPDHDASLLERELAGAPTAGFFAAGEIGPVGGENFLHGFTATMAIFAP